MVLPRKHSDVTSDIHKISYVVSIFSFTRLWTDIFLLWSFISIAATLKHMLWVRIRITSLLISTHIMCSYHQISFLSVPLYYTSIWNLFSSPEPLAHWWAYSMTSLCWGCLSSVVCHLSTFSYIFSAETTGLIEVKFHAKLPWDGGMKVFSQGPGHLTKMAALPI